MNTKFNKILSVIALFLIFTSTNIHSFELKNYLLNRDAQKFISKKEFNKSDSVLSTIQTEKFNDIVSYNKAIIHLNKGEYTKAYKYFEHSLKGNNINDDVIKYNMYKAIKDSGITQLKEHEDGIKTLESSLLKMRDFYKSAKDSSIKVQALHELYQISEILDQANKNKNKKKNKKNNKNQKKNQKNNKNQKKNQKNNNKNQNKNQNKDKNKLSKKKGQNKSYKMLLDNVREDRKNKVKKEIQAVMPKSEKEW